MLLVIAPPSSGLARQRATRSGTWSVNSSSALVPGWVSDPAYPCTITGGTTIHVAGSGAVTIAVNTSGSWGNGRMVQIRINGVQVAENAQSVSWTGQVSDGDTVEVWARATTGGVTITTGSIDITPE